MKKSIILCIEDHPEERFGGETLKNWLKKLIGSEYELYIEKDPDIAFELVRSNNAIELVLLDIEFDGDPRGPEIADTLYASRPDIKIIVLTVKDSRGDRITLRQRKNVWEYFVKSDFQEGLMRARFINIVCGLINDPFNKEWELQLIPEDQKLHLKNLAIGIEEEISIKSPMELSVLETCLSKPGKCINIIEMTDISNLSKLVKSINDKLREALNWHTWGFLDSKRCAHNEVKILVGNNAQFRNSEASVIADLAEIKEKISKIENDIKKLKRLFAGESK